MDLDPVPPDLDRNAERAQVLGAGFEPVAFLDPGVVDVLNPDRAVGERRDRGEGGHVSEMSRMLTVIPASCPPAAPVNRHAVLGERDICAHPGEHAGETKIALQAARAQPRDGDAAAGNRRRCQEVAGCGGVRLDAVAGGRVGLRGHVNVFPSRWICDPEPFHHRNGGSTYGAETRSVTVMVSPSAVSGPTSSRAVRNWEESPASRVTWPPLIPSAWTMTGWWPSRSGCDHGDAEIAECLGERA